MENETAKNETIGETKVDLPLDNIEIGEDRPQIDAAKVLIENYKIEEVKNKEGKVTGDKVVLNVRHPQYTDKLIDVSGVKYQKGDKLVSGGLWVNKDKDGKIPFKSALACFMRFVGARNIGSVKGLQVDTVLDDNGYLVVKAY